jgi:hypothetical protein
MREIQVLVVPELAAIGLSYSGAIAIDEPEA